MSDVMKDPAIKLFGRTIALHDEETAASMPVDYPDLAQTVESCELEKDICIEETNTEAKDQMVEKSEDVDHAHASSDINDGNIVDSKEGALDGNITTDSKPGQEEAGVDVLSEEKALKKPDKILPCPRCNNMDTKFCYYNNYNVNQPRHFCKNCQRYWTAGGIMRNVPVGAGRRKSKHSSSHYRHLVISSNGLPSSRCDNPDSGYKNLSHGQSTSAPPVNGNGLVLNFARDAPLCESMANVLVADQKRKVEVNFVTCSENVKEPSCDSSVTASKCKENDECVNEARPERTIVPGSCDGLTPINPLQCYPASPWAFPWNAAGWGNLATIEAGRCTTETGHGQENDSPKLIPWTPTSVMAASAFCAPPMPYPFFPASFWGCMPPWPGAWNVQWVEANENLSPSSSTSNGVSSGNDSPKLGKHSRDTGSNVAGKTGRSLWIPKTLRIDDPDEAAKSSIWATLGIKHDGHDPIAKGGIFKSFQPRIGIEDHGNDASQVLHANPAALSRSNKFQEST